jgi:hypothetical protein
MHSFVVSMFVPKSQLLFIIDKADEARARAVAAQPGLLVGVENDAPFQISFSDGHQRLPRNVGEKKNKTDIERRQVSSLSSNQFNNVSRFSIRVMARLANLRLL